MKVDGQGIDEHWGHLTRDGIKTYISDHLGTVVNSEVTNENKVTGAFGETLQALPSFDYTSNPVIYGFTGRQFEPESGLYYYRNRSYDPSSGRFMTKDPKGISAGDVNLYRYVGNNTYSNVDPNGTETTGVEISGTITLFSHSLSFGAQYVTDDKGGAGYAATFGYGPGGSVGLSAGLVADVSYTNASSIDQLAGAGGQTGAGAFATFGGQNELNYGDGHTGYISSLGIGADASAYTQVTATSVTNFSSSSTTPSLNGGAVCKP